MLVLLAEAASFHSGRTVDASLVGEVEVETSVVDDGFLRLDAHQAPCARAKVSELLVLGWYGCYGTGGVVTCYGYHWDGCQSCHLLHLFGQCADDGGRGGHLAKLRAFQS